MKNFVISLLIIISFASETFAEISFNPFVKPDRYSYHSIEDRDLEYLLSRMEKNKFGRVYSNVDIESRLDRLDSEIFGAIQQGDMKTRLNRLKHAFSAKNNNNEYSNAEYKNPKRNDFRGFFSSGGPTSIPVMPDYYSSFYNMFSAW